MERREKVTVNSYCAPELGVHIIDEDKCRRSCQLKNCVYICPAGIFFEKNDKVYVDSEGLCLECGACRLICNNIYFDYPPAGKGIIHRFG